MTETDARPHRQSEDQHIAGEGDQLVPKLDIDMQQTLKADQQEFEEAEDVERREIVVDANYELFVAALLVLQLINSGLLFLSGENIGQRQIVFVFWVGISVYLLIDALWRVYRRHKTTPRGKRSRGWNAYGTMLMIGSLPIPFITVVRLFALALVARKLRRGDVKEMSNVVISRHAQSTMLIVLLATVVFFEFGSYFILAAEYDAPSATITTSGDAIWWSLVTISTVGYGDMVPTTQQGRFIGIVLILTGVGLFTSITSFLARWFLRPRETEAEAPAARTVAPAQAPDSPHAQISEIRALLEQMQTAHQSSVSEVESRLAQLEDSLNVSR